MTETPPPGKTWVTVEIEAGTPIANSGPGMRVVSTVTGPTQDDLWLKAEERFRNVWVQTEHPSTTGRKLGEACTTLAEAIRATREAL